MEESRRTVLWLGLGLFVTGCTSQVTSNVERPELDWPGASPRPNPTKPSAPNVTRATTPSSPTKTAKTPAQPTATPPNPAPGPAGRPPALAGNVGPQKMFATTAPTLIVQPRTRWADQGPMMERINPMGDVDKITVHHEGWNPVVFTDEETTAERLELIRRSHIQRLGAGDIGYHFVVDRAGRVWEAREAKYQGAHVRGNNEHNIGVMCLGNFDIQSPSPEQLRSLVSVLKSLQSYYNVPLSKVKTHQEINPTACPGKVLQAYMLQIRKNKTLV
jgi:hypothetical protein